MGASTAYQLNDCAVGVTGIEVDDVALAEIEADVRAILQDTTGVAEAREAVSDLVKTDFASDSLEEVLLAENAVEEWRVGEAIAEEHLNHQHGCRFPWPDSRSTRNPNSSAGGVDLVGFHLADRARFVLAEVKTSHQQAWPPGTVTSRSHGLHSQLMGLAAADDRCRWAIRYLLMNGRERPWFGDFKAALETYLANKLDIIIFGVLVHATGPNKADLATAAVKLAESLEAPTSMALIALYISAEHLAALAGGSVAVETAP